MDIVYAGIVVILFVLAVFDLWVGVSNDAVNFLNSAIGSKAASFKTIIAIASLGVLIGAAMSNGMMEIARHGIYQPQFFYFNELMCIMVAVLVTDIVLLDIFNSLGMPTSTTVSLVFELLGGTVALALFKSLSNSNLTFAEMVNTDKAFTVIIAIFVSVAIAFIFGIVVQWISRLIFSFNYKNNLKYFIGLFGGLSITAIIYFMLIKGVSDLAFMKIEYKTWVGENTWFIVSATFLFSTLLMQLLYYFKINVFKIVVLTGTFGLAMAFAGNDLVNFIGVPLAGYSAFTDYINNSSGYDVSNYLMSSLNSPAKTPIIFLIASGCIMVISLMTSKKAQNVVKTSLVLSRQEEGEEIFGSSALARKIVRSTNILSTSIIKNTPISIRRWIDRRFNKDEIIIQEGASFDLLRASVNLVIASLLVALGTSMKLPLSTTYVTFMVGMGTSLADRAWSRESAVFRVTGVISVIGGWFITAIIAFVLCFIVASIMYFGGIPVIVLLVMLAIYILIKSNIKYKKKSSIEDKDKIFKNILIIKDKNEIWELLKEHIATYTPELMSNISNCYYIITQSFIMDDRKNLNKSINILNDLKNTYKKTKRRELIGMQKVNSTIAITKNTWFHGICNNNEQLIYSLKRISEPCKEHIDNNFNPMPEEFCKEFIPNRDKLIKLIGNISKVIRDKNCTKLKENIYVIDEFRLEISSLIKIHAHRMQDEMTNESMNIYLLYMNILQESGEIASVLKHLSIAADNFLKNDL